MTKEVSMISKIVELSIKDKAYVFIATILLTLVGLWSASQVSVDAVPDITSPQVQVNTEVPVLAPEEIEAQVTVLLERELAGLPKLVELRSLSRFGLSQITMTFSDDADIYRLRQLVTERLQPLLDELPHGAKPALAPIATGLGEIYYYTVSFTSDSDKAAASQTEKLIELRAVQDFVIRPLLRSTPGLADVNSMGGYEKQILIVPDLAKLLVHNLSLEEFSEIIKSGLKNTGGGAVEIGSEQIVIRTTTRATEASHLESIPIKFGFSAKPLTLGDFAKIEIGTLDRTGASTADGEETIVGGAIQLIGENSREVARSVQAKLKEIQEKLPKGVLIATQYNRDDLVSQTIETVEYNLFHGALLVVVILFFMLGNWKAALIVASVIPFSMLFALIGMAKSNISGNLMSLGAIDFGLLVDGAVVMVENIVRHLSEKQKALGRPLTKYERTQEVLVSAREVANPMFFGVLIVTAVYVPILALTGIEGKMFRPMALVVIFAMVGSVILALTLMPAACAFFLRGSVKERDSFLVRVFKWIYSPILGLSLRVPILSLLIAIGLFFCSYKVFKTLGSEFIPQLDEGSISLQMIRSSSLGLTASVNLQKTTEQYLLKSFPEISHIFARIGTAEIATDPMGPNLADTYIFLKEEREWRSESGQTIDKKRLIDLMRESLTKDIPGQSYLFTQPIQMRFNEMMAGARANLSLKIYGSDFATLEELAEKAIQTIRALPGSGDVEFDPFGRIPSVEIAPLRDKLRELNIHGGDINDSVRIALAGEDVGYFIDGNRRIPVTVRLDLERRKSLDRISFLPIISEDGTVMPLKSVANVNVIESISAISRESGQRRASILINPSTNDIEGFVADASKQLKESLKLPFGYFFEFGGQFRNLVEAKKRLAIVVPLTLAIILLFIFLTTRSFSQTLTIFLCVPLATTGGIFALAFRDMPFSISAAVGFIALSGIAVLNGLMLVTYINQLRREGKKLFDAVSEGALTRLRPKLMTALVASFGFVPMAVATGAGAEVQKPLATVVIGGIITSTFLSLILLPTLYLWTEKIKLNSKAKED